jgi:predicted Rdx family selenoprotein
LGCKKRSKNASNFKKLQLELGGFATSKNGVNLNPGCRNIRKITSNTTIIWDVEKDQKCIQLKKRITRTKGFATSFDTSGCTN